MHVLKKIDNIVSKIILVVSVFCFLALFAILLLNVIIRNTALNFQLSWYTEVVEILFAYMVMGTASLLSREKGHFKVDLLLLKFGNKQKFYIVEVLTNFIALIFFITLFYFGCRLFRCGSQQLQILQICKRWGYLSIPLNAVFLCIYTFRDLVESFQIFLGKKPVLTFD